MWSTVICSVQNCVSGLWARLRQDIIVGQASIYAFGTHGTGPDL